MTILPMRRAVVLLVLAAGLAPSGAALGQEGVRTRSGPPPTFRMDRWSTDEGLPSQFIVDLVQTADGYLWLSAGGELARFDGVRFRTVPRGGSGGLPPGSVGGLAAAGDTVWAVVDNTTVVRGVPGAFSTVGTVDGSIGYLARDRAGRVWAAGSALWRVDPDGLPRIGGAAAGGLTPDWAPMGPQMLPTAGGIWLRNHDDSTATALGPEGPRAPPFPIRYRYLPFESPAMTLLRDRGPDSVISLRDEEGIERARVARAPQRWPRLVDTRAHLWATRPGRIEVFLPGSREPLQSFDLGGGIGVGRMLEDLEGNIWATTATEGLVRLQLLPFTTIGREQGIGQSQVYRIARGGDGSVLAVDRSLSVYRIRGDSVALLLRVRTAQESGRDQRQAQGAFQDRRGTLWLGMLYHGPTFTLEGRRSDGATIEIPTRRTVHQILDDPTDADVLWATDGRIYRILPYAPGGPEVTPYLSEGWQVRHLIADGSGGIWAVEPGRLAHITAGDGVDVFEPGPSVTGGMRALHLDPSGTLWIGTYGSGLMRFRDGRFEPVGAADGLGDDVVSTILEDDAGNFWMGGNQGIHRVGRAQVEAFLEGEIPEVDGVLYGRRAGLSNPEGSGWHGYRDAHGGLWFPTFGGAAYVDPARAVALDARPPSVRIEEVRWGDGDARGSPEIRLPRGVRAFEITYTATSLRDPDALTFEYRLEGSDHDWVEVGGQRTARYTNVPRGAHTFRVRARNAGGVWSRSEAATVLVLPAYFHETAGFYVLVTAALLTLAAAAIRFRERRMRARATVLSRRVEERTRELESEKRTVAETLEVVRSQADELRSLDEAKSRFFANVSHELRTPLTLMLDPLRGLEEQYAGALPEDARRDLSLVRRSGRRLSRLVDELLDIARLDAGDVRVEARVADLGPFVAATARTFEPYARSSGIELEVHLADQPVPVLMDPDRLEKVVANLLGNALKYTGSGGHVELELEVVRDDENAGGDARARLTVRDDGPGIPPGEEDRIFERFHQVDDSAHRRAGGLGIGLALARELVHLHGGTIGVASEPGAGSAFWIELPLSREESSGREDGATPGAAPGGDAASAVERNPSPSPEAERAVSTDPAEGPGASPVEADEEDVTTVLLVEDHAELRAYIRRHLEHHYRVVEAADGEAGLRLARDVVPDLIVSDVMMPGMDGQALCEAVKADPEIDFVPVVLLTARASQESLLAGLEVGADDYVTKPFDIRELEARVGNIIQSRRRLRERFQAHETPLPQLAPPWPDTGDSSAEAFMARLYRELAHHLSDEDFQVDALADALGMSRSTLYRRVQEAVDDSPLEVLYAYRLDQAAQWLRETRANVSEVAYGVGFKSVPHFSRRFRQRFGTSPSAYRRGS